MFEVDFVQIKVSHIGLFFKNIDMPKVRQCELTKPDANRRAALMFSVPSVTKQGCRVAWRGAEDEKEQCVDTASPEGWRR